MKRILSLTLLSLFLTGCFSSSSSDKTVPLTEGSYVVQTASASWNDGSSVVVGNILGDRRVQQSILQYEKTDFTISTYENILYHIGKMGIDTISQFDSSKSIETPVWSYSANDSGEPAANPYKVVHVSDSKAYVIRYGSTKVWEINPSANTIAAPVTTYIDLSHYNAGGSSVPHMNDAVYYSGKLFVIMQRLDAAWDPTTSYIAVIDTATNEELETGEGQDGLKGIPLNADNAADSALHNGYLYVAGRGDYTNNSGALDKIDLTTYQVTEIAGQDTFKDLNEPDKTRNVHITDVAVVDNNNGYILISVEDVYAFNPASHIYSFNPSTGEIGTELAATATNGISISDITTDTNDRLWIAVTNADDPKLLVYDTDTNTQSGDSIELELIPNKIEFLTVK